MNNLVTIMVDDFPKKMFTRRLMPKTYEHLVDRGTRWAEAFHAVPVCDPSRMCFLTGRWVHNHHVYGNDLALERSIETGADRDTLATRLTAAGYHTALFGKYVHGGESLLIEYKPPGWDLYEPYVRPGNDEGFVHFARDGQKVTVELGPGSEADYLARRAARYINGAVARPGPFWLHLCPSSPHLPYDPADRYEHLAGDEPLYPSEGRSEADFSDKPGWIADDVPATERALTEAWRDKIEESRAVDDMVERVVTELRGIGQLSNTVIAFFSDNGYHFGEHKQRHKLTPYDEATRTPLVIRGPGFPAGVKARGLTSTLDVTPTLLRIAGADEAGTDGRVLDPLAGSGRETLFVENFMEQRWTGARSGTHLYVRHHEPEPMEELYDLAADPALNHSIVGDAGASAALAEMRSRVTAFEGCAGDACRSAENAP